MIDNQILIFVHTPKVAGGSLNRLIYSYFGDDNVSSIKISSDGEPYKLEIHSGIFYFPAEIGFFREIGFQVPKKIQNVLSRNDLNAVLGHSWFGIHQYLSKPFTYATLIRHPVDRIVSLYYHLNTWRKKIDSSPSTSSNKKKRTWREMSLEEFVRNPRSLPELDNDQTRRISGLDPNIDECTETTLAKAKENLRRYFSIVGVTDRFNETFILLKRTFNCSKNDISYYPKHINKKRPSIESLPPEAIAIILETNHLDWELYKFANDLLDEAISEQDSNFQDEVTEFQSFLESYSWYNEAFIKNQS